MKIKKENTTLIESILNEAEDVDVTDLNDASVEEIADEIQDSVEDDGLEISDQVAQSEAKEVDEFANLIYNPYGTAKPEKIEAVLQRCFEVALRQKRMGDQADFPNVLIYGQAGVGKSAIVKQFCEKHGLVMKTIKASTLSAETIRGIPYPQKNEKTRVYNQVLVTDPSWDVLNKPCVIFCDEYNRANPKAADYLLGLINEHVLPTTIEREDGSFDSEIFYPSVLFTVAAINPRTAAFKKTVEPLDAAQLGRFGAVIQQDGDTLGWANYFTDKSNRIAAGDFKKPKELKRDLKNLYSRILENPVLSDQDRAVYQGQAELARALIDNGLTWNTQDEIDSIYTAQDREGIINAYLTPRTLSMWLRMSNGTKKDFLKVINELSGLRKEDILKIKNCLANYTDKVTVGNNVFNSGPTTRTATTSAEKSLDDYISSLN